MTDVTLESRLSALKPSMSHDEMAAVTARIPRLLMQLVAGNHAHEVVTRLITDIADTVTRHLPAGFTLIAGTGGWRDTATGRTITEPTLVLVVLHPAGERSAVEAVARAWAERFGQQAVLRVEQPVSDLRF